MATSRNTNSSTTTSAVGIEGFNLVIVLGELAREIEMRTLPSGVEVGNVDVTVRSAGGQSESVPVAIPSPPAALGRLRPVTSVVVTGRVRRRFFRSGGRTHARTEVVADRVVRTTARTSTRRAVDDALRVVERI